MMLAKSMAVLCLFDQNRRELGILEIARLLGWPKSSTSRILASLASTGFLDRDQSTSRYRVGMRLAALGAQAIHSEDDHRLRAAGGRSRGGRGSGS